MPGYFEPTPEQASHAAVLATGCVEAGVRAILLDQHVTPTAFFDLSTRFAGELLHRLGLYGIRLAVVVADLSVYSLSFQDFAREANRGGKYRFFETAQDAVAWLESE